MLSFGLASVRATTAHRLPRLQLAQVSPSSVSPRPSVLTSDATGWSHACIECWASRARSTKSINCCPRLHAWLDQWAVPFFPSFFIVLQHAVEHSYVQLHLVGTWSYRMPSFTCWQDRERAFRIVGSKWRPIGSKPTFLFLINQLNFSQLPTSILLSFFRLADDS
jgi:hypothetical protein